IQRNVHQKKQIKSLNINQKTLQIDLQDVVAGQTFFVKLLLLVLILILCFMAGILAGYVGCLISLNLITKEIVRWSMVATLLVVSTAIVSAIFQNIIKNILLIVFSFLLVVIVIELLVKFEFIRPSPLFISTTLVVTAFCLGISSISFFVIRFMITLTDIVFSYSKASKIIIISTLFLAAVVGPRITIYLDLQTQKPQFKEVLLSTNLCRLITVSGTVYSLFLAFSAWLSNRLRGTPWNYPGLLRSWGLAVGSWGGTSFYNLDLSGVNFKNAKLANTDLRARKLYRTCFQGVTGLERARVDSRYLDLEIPKVQKLLTHGYSQDPDFSNLRLRGAYLQGADLRHIKLIDTDLTGVDLKDADLRGSILANAQVIDVDFTNANLTAICIQDWNVNSQTCFTNVQCDYIYRKLDDKGELTDRYPVERNFEPREFESLYQEVGNVVELVFKEGVNWRAFAFTLQKLQIEDDGLGLELKGIEKRGDLWVVKVTHNKNVSSLEVEKRLDVYYEELKQLLATKEQQINSLLGIATNQAEVIKEFSQRPFGNSFLITGSTITNLAGSGRIEYNEAAEQVRSIIANSSEPVHLTNTIQLLLTQLQGGSVATTAGTQAELIKQVLLSEAQRDTTFKQLLLQQSQQITHATSEEAIATAIQEAIAQLR
ncbi:MAG: pentapeptide repeat-containing protein, partial [Rhizonema sp. PD37]|nr:pentapeptide repeat-containing protein [Rhizonema sp. PD37]